MRRLYLTSALIALSLSSVTAIAKERCPGSLIPMYGRADASHIEAERQAQDPSILKQRAMHAIDQGWRYHFSKNDSATAMKRFNQAWLLEPNNAGAFHGMAVMSLVLSENPAYKACPFTPELAEQLFNNALAGHDIPPGAYADFGRFLVIQGRYNDAITHLEKALDLNPDQAMAKLHLAGAYAGVEDFATACPLIRQALDDLPQIPRNAGDEVCSKANDGK